MRLWHTVPTELKRPFDLTCILKLATVLTFFYAASTWYILPPHSHHKAGAAERKV